MRNAFAISAVLLLVVVPSALSLGGYTPPQNPTPYVKALFDNIKCEFQSRFLGTVCGSARVVKFQTQVVAGTNYKLYIETCPQSYAGAVVFVPLPVSANPFPKVTQVSSIFEPGPVLFG